LDQPAFDTLARRVWRTFAMSCTLGYRLDLRRKQCVGIRRDAHVFAVTTRDLGFAADQDLEERGRYHGDVAAPAGQVR